jgi:hypothetical protein
MNGLQLSPAVDPADPLISEEQLLAAAEEGSRKAA